MANIMLNVFKLVFEDPLNFTAEIEKANYTHEILNRFCVKQL